MLSPKKKVAFLSLLTLVFQTSEVGATSCNTRAFSGDWLGSSYGIACQLRTVASGNMRGLCHVEHYDTTNRIFYLETIEVDGRFNILSDCYIDGNIRSNRIKTILIEGRTWANQGQNPDEAYVMPSGNQTISLF